MLSKEQIFSHLQEMSNQISKAYFNSPKVIVLVLLGGAKIFADDLFKLIDDDKFQIIYIKASSYNGGLKTGGNVEISGLDGINLNKEDVLIVDDIYDSGNTMAAILDLIQPRKPNSVRTCVLLFKQIERKRQINIDFRAATVPDRFVVGYGLDYKGQYRDLPYVAVLEVINNNA